MSDTNKELIALLSEARNQLPIAASCWNEDEDRELAARNVEHVLGLIKRVDAVLALAPGLSGWQEISSAPKNRKVIVGYFNQLGKHRTVMASYYPAETLESEHTDSGWADEGWYEECESQSETIMPTDCEPTHWMPLPTAPGIAPHQPQPEGDYQRGWKDGNDTANKVHAALAQLQPEPTSKGEPVSEEIAAMLGERVAFLRDPAVYRGKYWDSMTNEQRKQAFTKLDGGAAGYAKKFWTWRHFDMAAEDIGMASQQREPQEAVINCWKCGALQPGQIKQGVEPLQADPLSDLRERSSGVEGSIVPHDWRTSNKLGGEICAVCSAMKGTRRGNLPCPAEVIKNSETFL